MRLFLRSLLLLLIGVGATLIWMLSHESDYIYYPDRELVQTPEDAGMQYRDVSFSAADGIKLHGWFMPHAHARFTLLLLHGNAGNISDRLAQYRHWHALGISVFAFDYRGYGNSEGEPSEEGLYADALAAWTLLQNQSEYGSSPIIIAGRSLGCAIAARLAAEVKPVALALETPFTSLPDMSREAYPWLPLYLFVQTRLDTRAAIAGVEVPLLLISAKDDEIIPAWMAEEIFAAANPPKLRGILDGGHNDFDHVSERAYLHLWQRWLNELSKQQQQETPRLQWVKLDNSHLL